MLVSVKWTKGCPPASLDFQPWATSTLTAERGQGTTLHRSLEETDLRTRVISK